MKSTKPQPPKMLDLIDRSIRDLERKRDMIKKKYDATSSTSSVDKEYRINLVNMMGVYNDTIILLLENKNLYYSQNN